MFNLEHPLIEQNNKASLDIDDVDENADDEDNINDNINYKIFALYNDAMPAYWVSVSQIYKCDGFFIVKKILGEDCFSTNTTKAEQYYKKISAVKNIKNENIPAIVLEEDVTYEQATEIFKRINSTGSKLSGTDLALAMLTLKWNECTDEFDEFLTNDYEEYGIDYLTIIRQLAIITTHQSNYNAFEKKRDVGEIKTAFESLKNIYNKVYDIMNTTFGIESLKLLPSKYPFYLLCYLAQQFSNDFGKNRNLKQWFFKFNAFGVYSSSSETKLQQHINLVKDSNTLDEALTKLTNDAKITALDEEYLKQHNTDKTSLFKMLYFIQREKGCRDWIDQNVSISISKQHMAYRKELHHIFPSAVLKSSRQNAGLTDSEINNAINDIANLTFITSGTNKKISKKEPIKYFEELQLFNEDKMKGHFISIDNKDIFKVKNYNEFLQARRKLIAAAINDFLGLKD